MNAKFQSLLSTLERLHDEDPFMAYGLRSTRHPSESKPGAKLRNSFVWEDGEKTNRQLNGVSTIGIPAHDINERGLVKAIQRLGRSAAKLFGVPPGTVYIDYGGDDVILVQGDSSEGGEDMHEYIIRHGQTVWSAKNGSILKEGKTMSWNPSFRDWYAAKQQALNENTEPEGDTDNPEGKEEGKDDKEDE